MTTTNSAGERLAEHESLLRAIAVRMVKSDEDADDIVQETLLRALAGSRDPDAPLAPWLVHVARNLAVDVLRRRSRFADVPVEEAVAPPGEPVALGTLLAGLGALTETEVVVLLLREVLDFSVDEVAAALETSAGSVRVLHHRARTRAARRSVDVHALRALERFLSWLLARSLAGLPVRSTPAPDDRGWTAGALAAQVTLLDAMVALAAEAGRDDLELRARIARGSTLRILGHPSRTDFTRAVALAEALGLPMEAAYARYRAAWVEYDLGANPQADQLAERGLAVLAAVPESERAARLRVGLLTIRLAVARAKGRDTTPLDAALRAAADDGLIPRALLAGNTGLIAIGEERWADAQAAFTEALAMVRALGHVRNEAAVASNLGLCAQGLGDRVGAAGWYRYAAECAARCGDRVTQARIAANQAVLAQLDGDFGAAAVAWERLLASDSGLGVAEVPAARMYAAILHLARGSVDRAARGLSRSLEGLGASDLQTAQVYLAAIAAERGEPAAWPVPAPGTGLALALPVLQAVVRPREEVLRVLEAADEQVVAVRLAAQVLRGRLARMPG